MKNPSIIRQNTKDGAYEKEYRKWVGTLSADERREMKKQGLLKPLTGYMVSKGPHDEEMIGQQRAPAVLPEIEEIEPERVGLMTQVMELTRIALCDILNPPSNSSSEYEAKIVGLAIGSPGLTSIAHQAKIFGVGRQAVSKRCVKFCKEHRLPPSPYMKSESNREKHQLTNVRKRKVANG